MGRVNSVSHISTCCITCLQIHNPVWSACQPGDPPSGGNRALKWKGIDFRYLLTLPKVSNKSCLRVASEKKIREFHLSELSHKIIKFEV